MKFKIFCINLATTKSLKRNLHFLWVNTSATIHCFFQINTSACKESGRCYVNISRRTARTIMCQLIDISVRFPLLLGTLQHFLLINNYVAPKHASELNRVLWYKWCMNWRQLHPRHLTWHAPRHHKQRHAYYNWLHHLQQSSHHVTLEHKSVFR